ncbi:MAG: integration host factor, actinobacterial type [Gammaproteobacteria bacterium]
MWCTATCCLARAAGGEVVRGKLTIPAVQERAKTDQVIGKTKITALLESLPGYDPARVNALLEQTGIVPSRRAAGLTERQRQALAGAVT